MSEERAAALRIVEFAPLIAGPKVAEMAGLARDAITVANAYLALSGTPGSVPPGALEEAEAIARQLVIAADADPELTMTMLLERGARAIRALCRLCALKSAASVPPDDVPLREALEGLMVVVGTVGLTGYRKVDEMLEKRIAKARAALKGTAR